MAIEKTPWLTPKRFWILVALFAFAALANCVGKTGESRPSTPTTGTGLSAESKQALAAMINVSGQLCANVNGVSALGNDRYTVACTRYKDGTGTASYEVDLQTGTVK
jgi:hypothetical protein